MRKLITVVIAAATILLLPEETGAQTKKPGGKSSLSASVERGQAIYATHCLTCHQADGSGVPRLNPPLYGVPLVTGSKRALIRLVLEGSSGKIEVDGEKFDNTMPAMQYLKDNEIADVLNYIRNSFGNKAASVSPSEVKTERARGK